MLPTACTWRMPSGEATPHTKLKSKKWSQMATATWLVRAGCSRSKWSQSNVPDFGRRRTLGCVPRSSVLVSTLRSTHSTRGIRLASVRSRDAVQALSSRGPSDPPPRDHQKYCSWTVFQVINMAVAGYHGDREKLN